MLCVVYLHSLSLPASIAHSLSRFLSPSPPPAINDNGDLARDSVEQGIVGGVPRHVERKRVLRWCPYRMKGSRIEGLVCIVECSGFRV